MIRHLLICVCTIGVCFGPCTYAQSTFNSFDALMEYASQKSLDLRKKDIEFTESKKQRLASVVGILDPTGNIRLSYVNNTELPVTIVPGELTGGQAGTSEAIQFGLQYETQFATEIDVKLLNLAGWSDFKKSKIDIDLSENSKKISRKELYESTASIYYNILTLQAQLSSTEANLLAADTLLQSVSSRFDKGLANQQDLNEAKVNQLQLKQSSEEIKFLMDQQYIALKLLCDIPESEDVRIVKSPDQEVPVSTLDVSENSLILRQAELNEKYARIDSRKSKFDGLPTLSFIVFNSRQQFNEQSTLFDSDVDWISSSYIGLRLSMPVPGSRRITNHFQTKYTFLKNEESRKQAEIQMANQTQKLRTDFNKAVSKEQFDASIYALKKETYNKNFLSYEQGILDLDQTLRSFQDMINAEYTWIASRLSIGLNQTKIHINNTIQ